MPQYPSLIVIPRLHSVILPSKVLFVMQCIFGSLQGVKQNLLIGFGQLILDMKGTHEV
jgi:hypothetical protein